MDLTDSQKILLTVTLLDQVKAPVTRQDRTHLCELKDIISALEKDSAEDIPDGKYFATH